MRQHMQVMHVLVLIAAVFVVGSMAAQSAALQEQEFVPTGSTWFEREAVYTTIPLTAALLGFVVQLLWHYRLVARDAANWNGVAPSGRFSALCGGPIILGVVLIAVVAGLFVYIAYGSPESADEWPSHARAAYWSLAGATAILFLPWTATLFPWRNR